MKIPAVNSLGPLADGGLEDVEMTRFLKSEAGAVVVWVVATLLLAAAISPWLFSLGKDFAVQHSESGGLFGRLAGSCERARFSRYFNRSLMISALLLLVPLWLWLRTIARNRDKVSPILPPGMHWKRGLSQSVAGFVAAAGLLWLLGIVVSAGGSFEASGSPLTIGRIFGQAVVPALGASIVEEWLFRGLLLGLWLRFCGPLMACVGTSLIFAFVHFLDPPSGAEIADSRAWHAGFELLGLILRNYLHPEFLTADFLTLFVIGMSLAWARVRSGSLWLPLGMHAGWVFAFKLFNMTHASAGESGLGSLLIGDTLRSGLLPLVTLVITWLVLVVMLRRQLRGSGG